jgi:hypothetical protein
MIRHVWSVLCRRSIVDSESNNISLSDVLEQIEIKPAVKQKKYVVPLEFEITSLWMKTGDKKQISAEVFIKFTDPSDNLIKVFNNKFTLTPDLVRMRTRMKVMGIELSEIGIYNFNIFLKTEGSKREDLVASLPLDVRIV